MNPCEDNMSKLQPYVVVIWDDEDPQQWWALDDDDLQRQIQDFLDESGLVSIEGWEPGVIDQEWV